MKKDLNDRSGKLNREFVFNPLLRRRHKIYQGGTPINEINWTFSEIIDDKVISMLKWKYVEYNDLINISIRPFKKD